MTRRGNSTSRSLTLSILDQAPVATGSTPSDALHNAIALARHGEALGYARFWMSEHHAMDTLACTAPEVMLARIGAETSTIRIGSGGVMLPHYSPLKVAECFRTLHALYPGRVDLGIGRAPGGGPIEAHALRRDRTRVSPHASGAEDFDEQMLELLAWLDGAFPAAHPFAKVSVAPNMPGAPDVWLLGSSLWSGALAAQLGLPYAFAHFFSPVVTREAIERYHRAFVPGPHRAQPEAMITVGVLCASTDEEAEYLHASVRLLQRRIRQGDRRPVEAPDEALRLLGDWSATEEEGEWPRYFVGTPERVRRELSSMAEVCGVEELGVVTITHSRQARFNSYTLLAEAFDLTHPDPSTVVREPVLTGEPG